MQTVSLRSPQAIGASVVVAIALVVAGVFVASGRTSQEASNVNIAEQIGADELVVASSARVFFGHQSVGMNVLDGVPDVYAAYGMQPPAVHQLEVDPDAQAAHGILHAYIGENGDPVTKIADFEAQVRGGLGSRVDVALMKLCYLDVNRSTDVEAVFDEYQSTLARLEKDFPDTTFLHVTTPLTTEPDTSLKERVKRMLGRGSDSRPDNVAREKYNTLMREAYSAAGTLLDLAATESTTPDGTRVYGEFDGQPYFALYQGFASDPGHLNEAGSAGAAADFLALVADQVDG